MFREAGTRLIAWLTGCINASLRLGKVTTDWLRAIVIALPKPKGGFRPISLLSNLCKIVERIVFSRLKGYCSEHDIIPENQFTSTSGTGEAVRRLVDCVTSNGCQPTYVVFFDVKKAFDRVHVPTLLSILTDIKCPKYLRVWIQGFLTIGLDSFKITNL